MAKIWYFTRLQLERMGDKIRDKEHLLRAAVTFQEKFMDLVPPGVAEGAPHTPGKPRRLGLAWLGLGHGGIKRVKGETCQALGVVTCGPYQKI